MNQEKFIETIKIVVERASIEDIEANLLNPPGRSPSKNLVEMSNWFRSLSKDDKVMALRIAGYAARASVFGFLCVLDGVRMIEEYEERGELELYYVKGDERVLLNDPKQEFLHDILNAE